MILALRFLDYEMKISILGVGNIANTLNKNWANKSYKVFSPTINNQVKE